MKGLERLIPKFITKIDPKLAVFAAGTVILLSLPAGCNRLMNTKTENMSGTVVVSRAKGIYGHTDYFRYPDGSQEFRDYAGLGLRVGSIITYKDDNGDGEIDMMFENGAEWKMHRLKYLWTRAQDYAGHEKEFQTGEKKMQESYAKYKK